VVTERSFADDEEARVGLIRAHWPTTPTVPALERLLGLVTPGDPGGSVCVDVPDWNYGTRSSLVLVREAELAKSRWFECDGPPDRTPFVERPELISALAS
jgi:hypothetical protein